MKIIVVDNYNEMSKKAANIIASCIVLKPNSVLGLATGSTPLGVYKELIKLYENSDVDFSNVCTFNLDEYYGITKDNDQSYSYYMKENFFKHVNLKEENTHIPDGTCKNVDTMCQSYEDIIKQHGGIDVQILGIGQNGHIGFNEPDDKFVADTHLVKLKEDTVNANSRFFETIEDVPKEAVSMGIKAIMKAKKIILIANGINKAEAIYKTIKEDVTPEVPASILQFHSDVTVIVDKEAASKL
ncbi:glucosamine-6-phosphate deaminase [Abyssisolibacter fermentans]|uniref:glucosamine-6-phosphate deaminase n=1 Tax=Abyssisolibacter fermentans TaxID=1766203 RepID=UPI000830EC72|nr:glucosamine-6-phosphate deaminase [Abyssisolibacter fermentans]